MSIESPVQRLNFVVILTDDQGRWAMPHRMPELVMPHVEALLEESLELDQMYCASPVCSPSRASMLTGRMPSAHGVHDWLIGGRHPEAHPDRYLEGQPTTPEVLADAGYQCAMSGKWHVGHSQTPAPGFEFWYAHRYGGGPYYGAPIWRDGEEAEEPRYFTEAVTENALDFLATRDPGRPFYLQVNFTAPHDPWIDNHPPELVGLYADTDFPSVPRGEPHPWVAPRRAAFAAAFADPQPHLAGYCASLTAVDRSLGEIRKALEEQGISDDTVVVYLSDNGFSCGHHGIWGKGNGTFPLNFWDNSVRVPCVVHLPGGATGVSDALLSSVSLHRTVCELAGVEVPDDTWGAGKSFAHVLRGDESGGEEFVVVTSEYGGARMITDKRHKLVERFDGPGELYDLERDLGERENRFDDPSLGSVRETLSRELWRRFDAHTRPGVSAWERPVTGYGQIQPTSRGLPDVDSYAQTPNVLNGVRVTWARQAESPERKAPSVADETSATADRAWLPVDWQHPTRIELSTGHHLRPIRAADTDLDMPAVMGSRERLWSIYGDAWGWPPATMTAEQDREDLQRHADEIEAHESFNYALFDADETELIGCVYIDPPEKRGADAEISWWVRDEYVGSPVEAAVDELVPAWIAEDWPLTAPRYVGRDLSWAQWMALPDLDVSSGW